MYAGHSFRMQHENIIFFDGVCNLCNNLVRFVLRYDRSGSLMFAPLQSGPALTLLEKYNVIEDMKDSVILITDGKIFRKSSAILHIARIMGWPWKLLYAFRIIPAFIRDALYNIVARYRFRLFGKRETCMIPGPDVMKRFIR